MNNFTISCSSCIVSASGALPRLFSLGHVLVAGTSEVTVAKLQSSSVDGGRRSVPTNVEPLAKRQIFTEEVATDSNLYSQTQTVSISLDEYQGLGLGLSLFTNVNYHPSNVFHVACVLCIVMSTKDLRLDSTEFVGSPQGLVPTVPVPLLSLASRPYSLRVHIIVQFTLYCAIIGAGTRDYPLLASGTNTRTLLFGSKLPPLNQLSGLDIAGDSLSPLMD